MKSKTLFTRMLMILLTLSACNKAGSVKPAAEKANRSGATTVQSEPGTATDQVSVKVEYASCLLSWCSLHTGVSGPLSLSSNFW